MSQGIILLSIILSSTVFAGETNKSYLSLREKFRKSEAVSSLLLLGGSWDCRSIDRYSISWGESVNRCFEFERSGPIYIINVGACFFSDKLLFSLSDNNEVIAWENIKMDLLTLRYNKTQVKLLVEVSKNEVSPEENLHRSLGKDARMMKMFADYYLECISKKPW